jgi:hypothetical protein
MAPITFRDAGLEPVIDARMRNDGSRESLGLVAKRDLRRYYDLIGAALPDLDLSPAEACLICDALADVQIADDRWLRLWAEISDGVRAGDLATKWGLSEAAVERLIERVRLLPPSGRAAICDAVERFWIIMRHKPKTPLNDALEQVGLLPHEESAPPTLSPDALG